MIIRPATSAGGLDNKVTVIYTPNKLLLGIVDMDTPHAAQLSVETRFPRLSNSGTIKDAKSLKKLDSKLNPVRVSGILKIDNPFDTYEKAFIDPLNKPIMYDFSRTYANLDPSADPVEIALPASELETSLEDTWYFIATIGKSPLAPIYKNSEFILCMPKINL